MRVIGCVLFMSMLLFPVNTIVHVQHGNIFNGSFIEPTEICYAIFYDGYFMRFTTYHENTIVMSYETFKETVEKKGYEVRDIAIIIHNHLPGQVRKFTRGDLYFLGRMRGDEFEGSFCLWYIEKVIRCKR